MPGPLRLPTFASGLVYADNDRDGRFSTGDQPLPDVLVAFEQGAFAISDAAGHYRVAIWGKPGIVWARSIDGYAPGPYWQQIPTERDITVDFGLLPAPATSAGTTFVQVSDTHIGNIGPEPVTEALAQAILADPPPDFLVVTGDIASWNESIEYDEFSEIARGLDVPWVPVPGNHDWHDVGVLYRSRFGPSQYSFERGGVHFLVLNFNQNPADIAQFVMLELAQTDPALPVVAFYHASPTDEFAAVLAGLGVDYLFTGHTHANRVIQHGALLEVNTQTAAFGALDYTPAGYRVVTFDGGLGVPRLEHHTVVNRPVLQPIYPRPWTCVPRRGAHLIVAAELGGATPTVTATIDGAPPVTLRAAGGWTFVDDTDLGTLAPGKHLLELHASGGRAAPVVTISQFCVAEDDRAGPAMAPGAAADWPQHQGSAGNDGATATRLAPPLHVAWAHAVGGHLNGGSPAVAEGRLFVPVVDYGDGSAGGVVALDARTGEVLWDRRTGVAVHGAPAVADGLVVFAAADGVVHAVQAASGAPVWDFDLGAGAIELNSWLYTSPAIAGGVVYIGLQQNFAAIDLQSGAQLWRTDPEQGDWAITLSSVAVGDDVGVAVIGRGFEGVFGWDPRDGRELWRIPPALAVAVNASPVIADDTAWLVDVESKVTAIDVHTGDLRWRNQLYNEGVDWGFGPVATPALADGRLFVPTPRDYLYALDAASGDRLWRVGAGDSVIRPLPYKVAARGFVGAAVVTGDVVWAGATDGVLRAIDAASGAVLWSSDLGAPILSGVVPYGETLFVATYDGTIRALVAGDDSWNFEPRPARSDGCAIAPARRPAAPVLLLLVLLLLVLLTLARRRITKI